MAFTEKDENVYKFLILHLELLKVRVEKHGKLNKEEDIAKLVISKLNSEISKLIKDQLQQKKIKNPNELLIKYIKNALNSLGLETELEQYFTLKTKGFPKNDKEKTNLDKSINFKKLLTSPILELIDNDEWFKDVFTTICSNNSKEEDKDEVQSKSSKTENKKVGKVNLTAVRGVTGRHIALFASDEHKTIGNAAQHELTLPPALSDTEEKQKINLKNYPLYYFDKDQKTILEKEGLDLSEGTIIKLIGDYIGGDKPIKGDLNEFKEFYNKLSGLTDEQIKEINKILKTKYVENETINSYLIELELALKIKGYFSLLDKNYDHFAPWSRQTYKTGHEYAKSLAKQSKELMNKSENNCYDNEQKGIFKEKAKKLMIMAYQVNAAACHFYTDNFAGGHLREGQLREQLPKQFDKGPLKFGSILLNNMHEDDGWQNGGVWCEVPALKQGENKKIVLFKGDDHLNDDSNKEAKDIVIQAVKRSQEEIFEAFTFTGEQTSDKKNSMDYIPKPLSIEEAKEQGKQQPAPLFQYNAKTKKILIRYPIDETNPDLVTYKEMNFKTAFKAVVRLRLSSFKPHYTTQNELLSNEIKKLQDYKVQLQKEKKSFFSDTELKTVKLKAVNKLLEELRGLNKDNIEASDINEVYKHVANELAVENEWGLAIEGVFSRRLQNIFKDHGFKLSDIKEPNNDINVRVRRALGGGGGKVN